MKIKLLGMDVDGTLTDGRIYMGQDGEIMKAFDVKDGYGIVQFRKSGGIPVVITGRESRIVEQRCRELGITELHQGVSDKLGCLMSVAERYGLEREQVAYIGDDLNDLDCIHYAGISACPADAAGIVKASVDFVCSQEGGRGAVREFIEWLANRENSHENRNCNDC